MTNFSQGEKLLLEAEMIFRTIADLLVAGSWNMAIRRSQEVVELCLKGILKMVGVEYPKVHDVGLVFRESIEKRSLDVEEGRLSEIEEISAYLARERASAFYYDKEYTKEEANRARGYAQKVLEFATGLAERLKKRM